MSTKPSFTSPQPLAAASSLTIPLQITLSEIKLSAFIILVFSKQKGLTLVFRNDPLESLKVSSTFDSIPFVREYLQKEIEGQLRTLLMDEVPAIIHRLSLRLWVPEYKARENEELARNAQKPSSDEKIVDPLANPPQDPVDPAGHILNASQIASLSLDSGSETHSLFSQKNLLRLGALTDSHRTLSLFTPSIRDAVFRAWAGPTERGESFSGHPPTTPMMPTLSRSRSYNGSTSTTYVFSDNLEGGSHLVRPTLLSSASAATGLGLGSNRHGKAHGGRKRKHRVVNLRKKSVASDELESVSGEGSTMSETGPSASSEHGLPLRSVEEREDEVTTPPRSPERLRADRDFVNLDPDDVAPALRKFTSRKPTSMEVNGSAPTSSTPLASAEDSSSSSPTRTSQHLKLAEEQQLQPSQPEMLHESQASSPIAYFNPQSQFPALPFSFLDSPSGGILEQAWMMKMAGEIARRVHDEKVAKSSLWERAECDETPPPAYGS